MSLNEIQDCFCPADKRGHVGQNQLASNDVLLQFQERNLSLGQWKTGAKEVVVKSETVEWTEERIHLEPLPR